MSRARGEFHSIRLRLALARRCSPERYAAIPAQVPTQCRPGPCPAATRGSSGLALRDCIGGIAENPVPRLLKGNEVPPFPQPPRFRRFPFSRQQRPPPRMVRRRLAHLPRPSLLRLPGVVRAHQLQHSPANFRRLGLVRYPAHVAVLQCSRLSRAVAPPDPLGPAITDSEHPRRLAELQLTSLHPAQQLAPSSFLGVPPCPFHLGSSFGALD